MQKNEMISLNRDYFLKLYEKINTDEDYNLNICSHITPQIIPDSEFQNNFIKEKIINQFKKNGFSLISFSKNKNFIDILEWASDLLGPPVPNSANPDKFYSKIIAEENGKYFANTHFTQPLHTDDAHILTTPRIITLFCEYQAAEGGITTLVKFSDIYQKLSSQLNNTILEHLYSKDAIELEGVKGIIQRPFFYHLEKNLNGLVFPAFLFNIKAKNNVLEIFKKMTDLIHERKNQIRFKLNPGELLLIDNFRVLHGRTKFDLLDKRILYRFCFGNKIFQ